MSVEAEMPRYKSHKEVHALQIESVKYHVLDKDSPTSQGGWVLTFVDAFIGVKYSPINVTYDWITKHEPKAGGYYVVYDGEYASYSPAEAFESGYTLVLK